MTMGAQECAEHFLGTGPGLWTVDFVHLEARSGTPDCRRSAAGLETQQRSSGW